MIESLYSSIALLTMAVISLNAGYEQPAYLDGCISVDGRYKISAKQTLVGKSSHGPNHWNFIWEDIQTGEKKEFPAQGIQGGQVHGQLFVTPGGETFAFWNHITMYWEEKSHMHASSHGDVVKREKHASAEYRNQMIFKNRLVIYRKDGSILKSYNVGDFIQDEEWESVLPVFNRVHWLKEYDNLNFKETPRIQYAYYRISPDYSVIEFQPVQARSKRNDPPRKVRVDLITGEVIPEGAEFEDKAKIPVRPFLGPDHRPANGQEWTENYDPGLDPVRVPGTYAISPASVAFPPEKAPKKLPEFKVGKIETVAKGFLKADTPSWMESTGKKPDEQGRIIFTDLDANKLFTIPPSSEEPVLLMEGVTRGRMVGRTFYGMIDGKFGTLDLTKPDAKPEFLIESGIEGREFSLNDLVVSRRGFVYFTTLKDPEKGRLTVLDPETRKTTVLFDGEVHPNLANPNGIALSRNERFLYVGISNYNDRKYSGVYAFPIKGDGTIDLEVGMQEPRFTVKAPDGIVTDRQGNVYFTAGNEVHVFTPYAQQLAKIKIPKGSGTNLCFGGEDRFARDLYVTTREALYKVKTPFGGK